MSDSVTSHRLKQKKHITLPSGIRSWQPEFPDLILSHKTGTVQFVLNQQDNDVVIIVQPEDDLDNQTIYDDVIKIIWTMKPRTQFIFAIHNANILVQGKEEKACACEYAGGKIQTSAGGVDAPLYNSTSFQ